MDLCVWLPEARHPTMVLPVIFHSLAVRTRAQRDGVITPRQVLTRTAIYGWEPSTYLNDRGCCLQIGVRLLIASRHNEWKMFWSTQSLPQAKGGEALLRASKVSGHAPDCAHAQNCCSFLASLNSKADGHIPIQMSVARRSRALSVVLLAFGSVKGRSELRDSRVRGNREQIRSCGSRIG